MLTNSSSFVCARPHAVYTFSRRFFPPSCMSIRAMTAAMLAFFAFTNAAPAFATSTQTGAREQPSEEIAAQIYRPCKRTTEQDRVRCEARALLSWQQSLRQTRTPRHAIEVYKDMDMGQGDLRKRLQAERLQQSIERGKARKSYRQLEPTDDINTERHGYLKDLRAARLQCMLERPGRPRSMCLNKIAREARDAMRATRGSLSYPAN